MKLLKITNKKGFLCINGKEILVSEITPEDISTAVEVIVLADKEVDFDDDYSIIANPAQKIIYEQLLQSFKEVSESKASIQEEVNGIFAKAEEKYFQ